MFSFICWIPDESDEGDFKPVPEWNAAEAAKEFAEQLNDSGEFSNERIVCVRHPVTGELKRFRVRADPDIRYFAWDDEETA